MPRFRNFSIQKKLIAIITMTAAIALLLACSAFMNYELETYRSTSAARLQTMAQMIEGTSTAALAFGDKRAAGETLATLRRQPQILEGGLYGRDGAPLASYLRPQTAPGGPISIPARPGADGAKFDETGLTIFHPVLLENERVGTVYLKSDLAEMQARLSQYAGIAVLVFLASMLAAWIVSALVQRLISTPILQLADAAGRISKDGDYSVRTVKTSADETGVLVDRFNEMLEQIQARDKDLQSAREELERRVAERTSQLQSEIGERKLIAERLILAKNAAEASSRAKSEFLANMSHELRTPLNAIIGYSEMLEEDATSIAELGMIPDLRRIHSSGKHLLSLINDVLDLSKIEAGRLEIHPERFDARTLADEVIATTEPLAHKRGNRLEVQCDFLNTIVSADPLKLRQTLLNLVSNACKFTENGTITIRLRRFCQDGQEWFEWAVSDTGVGIPAGKMPQLFQAFSQVDTSSTRKHGGTGLGLAISRRLCELMGGQLVVVSELGLGSTFTVRLPAVSLETPEPREPQPAGEENPDQSGRKTILIIDDDPSVRDLLARSLQKRDFAVLTAANGEEGLKQASQHTPFAIILDVRMPDIDGWVVFRALRADARFQHTPIMVHTITDTRPAGLAFDSAEFLQKPVAVEHLVSILRKYSGRPASEPPAQPPTQPDGGLGSLLNAVQGQETSHV